MAEEISEAGSVRRAWLARYGTQLVTIMPTVGMEATGTIGAWDTECFAFVRRGDTEAQLVFWRAVARVGPAGKAGVVWV